MSYAIDFTKTILNVLQKLDKPMDVDEIAFRVRSTPTIIREQLEKLTEAQLVTKVDTDKYRIAQNARSSSLESIYSY